MATKVIDFNIQANTAKIWEMKEALSKVNEELKGAQGDQFRKIKKEADELNKSIIDLTKSNKQLKDVNGTVNATFEQMYGEVLPLTAQIGELEDRMYALARAGEADSQEFKNLQQEAANMKRTIVEVDNSVDDLAGNRGLASFGTNIKDIGASLLTLDFNRANTQAKGLAASAKNIDFKQAVGSVKDLGSTFVNLGKALLTNPLFLMATLIGILVIAFVKLMDKLGILKIIAEAVGKVFEFIGDILDWIADGIAKFTDAIGLTNVAQEKAAEKYAETTAKRAEAQELAEKRITGSLDLEIRRIKATGDESDAAFEKILAAEKKKRIELNKTALARAEEAFAAYEAAKLKGDLDEKELADLKKKKDEQMTIASLSIKELEVAELEDDKKRKDRKDKQVKDEEAKDKAAADKSKQNADKARQKAREYAENRLKAERQIEDMRIALIEDDNERAIEANRVKYQRLIQDTIRDSKILGKAIKDENNVIIGYEGEKGQIIKLLQEQQAKDNQKILDDKAKKEEEVNKKIADENAKAALTQYETASSILQSQIDDAQRIYEEGLKNDKKFNDEKYKNLLNALNKQINAQNDLLKEQQTEALRLAKVTYDEEIKAAGDNAVLKESLTKNYNAQVGKINEDFRTQEAAAEKKYQDDVIKAGEDAAAKEKEILEKRGEEVKRAFETIASNIKGALADSQSLGADILIAFTDNLDNLYSTIKNLADEIKKIDFSNINWEDLTTSAAAAVSAVGSLVSSIIASFQADNQREMENELSEIDDTATQQQEILKAQYDNQLLTKDEYEKAKNELDKQTAAKELAVRKKSFDAEQKMKIAQTWVAGISGAVSAFAGAMQLGPIAGPIVGGVLAAAVLGLTAKSASNIKKQKFDGGGGGGDASTPSMSGGDAGASPTTALFGGGNNANNLTSPETQEQKPIVVQTEVNVSAVEITNVQQSNMNVADTGTLKLQ